MPRALEEFLRRTPVYPLLRRIQHSRRLRIAARDFWKWSDDDEKRAGFYRQFIRPGDLVFDVGANMGNRAKVFHRLGANVVAFEPQQGCYNFLRDVFQGKDRIRLVNRALGATAGTTQLLVADADILSSLSPGWIEAVQKSGRFRGCSWDRRENVAVTTLDQAIGEFGSPAFLKIDVEGYESEVVRGLSTPVTCLSVEFTAEFIANTLQCIDHLGSLGPLEGRLSYGESMEFSTASWLSTEAVKQELIHLDKLQWGDCYLRCLAPRTPSGSSVSR